MPMDPTALASGGFAGEGTITDPAFTYDERFTNDNGDMQCLLSFTLDPADGEHDAFTKFYQCGDGWEPADGGKRVVWAEDPDNDRKAFGSTSKIGRLITAIVKAAPDVIADRYADGDGVGADSAAMFEGLRFVWADDVKVKNVRQPDGSWKPSTTGETTSLLLPVEFVEVVGGGTKAKKAPAKKAAPAAAAAPAEAAEEAPKPAKKAAKKKAPAPAAEPAAAEGGFPAELEDAAYAIYQEVDGDSAFDDWLTQVIALDGIEAHIDYVTEPEEGGLWDALTDRYEAEG